jgi:large subunit ribosomal protein L6
MSRIGRLPVAIPAGCTVAVDGGVIRVKGPKGEMTRPFETSKVSASIDQGRVLFKLENPEASSYFGMLRKLVANMVKGVTDGFERRLEISGVGYKAQIQGQKMVLNVGFSHAKEVAIPPGVSVAVEDNVRLVLRSHDRQLLGDFAAFVRGIRPPEPYLGKGIKYSNEVVRGKTGA